MHDASLYVPVCVCMCFCSSGYLIASRLFMCLALGAGLFAWVVSIVGLIQHRAVWLMISGVCYAVQGEGVCACTFV